MAHQSENSKRLTIHTLDVSNLSALPTPSRESAAVWLFVLPFGRTIADAENSEAWFAAIHRFALSLHEQSVVAMLTSAQDAAETWPRLSDVMQFQLWVAVKLDKPIVRTACQLPEHHAALLILSKYRTSLKHTKTRIGYTYCPACDKTTKDYGGKKHTYHEYGTLLSDVWRDIVYKPGEHPTDITTRLADLFGLDPFRKLTVVNLGGVRSLHPKQIEPEASPTPRGGSRTQLESRLINGDSLAELRKLPDNSVDFCYADPPYNLAKRYDSWDDAIDVKEYLAWCDSWIDELARVLRPGCTCAVLNIPILAIRHFQHMKRELVFQSWIAWEGLSLPVRMIMPAHYATVCFSKGVARPLPGLTRKSHTPLEQYALTTLRENYCVRQACVAMRQRARHPDREPITDLWWDIHRLKHNSRRVDHPCQLPPALMRRLIALFTNENELVLDPFNGAGTTTLCAAGLGRRYIGIELSEKYHAIALARHKLLQEGGDPFEKVNGVPKAKNSRVERIGGIRYEVPKKTLQLEVKRVAKILGHIPSRDELERYGKYPIRYYDEYFISWGEVCAAARTTGMNETRNGPKVSVAIHQPTLFDPVLPK
ncbi:DNA methyltransferase [Fontivita pretiosa]|uniref:DNA methyltransferase n=1 Tax=Fontivita pretiosa TaxID=2989684 RepID=UPI003D181F9C